MFRIFLFFIEGMKVERVDEYKYLGTVLDNKFTCTPNTDFIHKKCQQGMYCLQKIRCHDVYTKTLRTFYRSFIESVLMSLLRLYAGMVD